jgi:hypothetical protein
LPREPTETKSLASGAKQMPVQTAVGWMFYHLLRGLERRISPGILRMILLPCVCLFTLFQWDRLSGLYRGFSRPFARHLLPGNLPMRLYRQQVRYHLSRILSFWPDRLASERWRRRCRITGLDHLAQSRDGDRPVILACLHFGPPPAVLRYWLRAHAIPAVFLVREPPLGGSSLKRRMDSLSGFPHLPSWLTLQQLRQARQVLQAGACLMIAVDGGAGKQLHVRQDGGSFLLSTGAMRLASSTGAELIPCLIAEEAGWHFRLHFGRPTPSRHLKSGHDGYAAAQHLVEEFMPVIQAHPEQCGSLLLGCFLEPA